MKSFLTLSLTNYIYSIRKEDGWALPSRSVWILEFRHVVQAPIILCLDYHCDLPPDLPVSAIAALVCSQSSSKRRIYFFK